MLGFRVCFLGFLIWVSGIAIVVLDRLEGYGLWVLTAQKLSPSMASNRWFCLWILFKLLLASSCGGDLGLILGRGCVQFRQSLSSFPLRIWVLCRFLLSFRGSFRSSGAGLGSQIIRGRWPVVTRLFAFDDSCWFCGEDGWSSCALLE